MNRQTLIVECVLLHSLLLFASGASGAILYVDANAVGTADGSSWVDAFTLLHTALIAAEAGDEIRVAQGFYVPREYAATAAMRSPHGTGSSVTSFVLPAGVTLRGGFAGLGAEEPNARDIEQYMTVLSGDLYNNDVDSWDVGHPLYSLLHSDNRAVVIESGATESTIVLDGFVIKSAVQHGLYNRGGTLKIANCTFRVNVGQETYGAAICSNGGDVALSNCVFEDNLSLRAGGAIAATDATLTMSDCCFLNNWANYSGGVIYVLTGNLTMTNCSSLSNWSYNTGGTIYAEDANLAGTGCAFTENGAYDEGGAIYQRQGTLTLADCTFEENMAQDKGGAVSLTELGRASMTRCRFRHNWMAESGGAIMSDRTPMSLDACTFSGNRAESGGAVHVHESLSGDADSQAGGAVITHCLFAGNVAYAGGALRGYPARFAISNSTFADNLASKYATLLWEAWSTQVVVTMENCIVWDGEKSISPMFAGRSSSGEPALPRQIVVRYCDVEGAWPGEGNIDADPCFVQPGCWDASDMAGSTSDDVWVDGDYHLRSQAGRWDPASGGWVPDDFGSPCIDAGDPNSPIGEEPEPNGGRINQGVYGGTAQASKSF
ncbi:MAG: hypothetical protein KBE65_05600 [Phycisphaerae bacterium]|nr:hypothetical protein [Phycisphaerae bacterium]